MKTKMLVIGIAVFACAVAVALQFSQPAYEIAFDATGDHIADASKVAALVEQGYAIDSTRTQAGRIVLHRVK